MSIRVELRVSGVGPLNRKLLGISKKADTLAKSLEKLNRTISRLNRKKKQRLLISKG